MPFSPGRPTKYKTKVIFTTSFEGDLLERFKDVASREQRYVNDLLMDLMADYLKKHEASQNPQPTLDLFDRDMVCSIPNLYRDRDDFVKFYEILNAKEDYIEIEKQLQMAVDVHNA